MPVEVERHILSFGNRISVAEGIDRAHEREGNLTALRGIGDGWVERAVAGLPHEGIAALVAGVGRLGRGKIVVTRNDGTGLNVNGAHHDADMAAGERVARKLDALARRLVGPHRRLYGHIEPGERVVRDGGVLGVAHANAVGVGLARRKTGLVADRVGRDLETAQAVLARRGLVAVGNKKVGARLWLCVRAEGTLVVGDGGVLDGGTHDIDADVRMIDAGHGDVEHVSVKRGVVGAIA